MKISNKRMVNDIRKDMQSKIVDTIIMERQSEMDKNSRLESDYARIREVVDYFYEVVENVSVEEQQKIEKTLFDGRSSRNRLGTILFLNKYADGRYPNWVEKAKIRFGINY